MHNVIVSHVSYPGIYKVDWLWLEHKNFHKTFALHFLLDTVQLSLLKILIRGQYFISLVSLVPSQFKILRSSVVSLI